MTNLDVEFDRTMTNTNIKVETLRLVVVKIDQSILLRFGGFNFGHIHTLRLVVVKIFLFFGHVQ